MIDYGIMNHSDCNDDFLKKCTGLYIFMRIFNYRFILTCRPFHATQLTDGFSHKILASLIHPSHFAITRKSLAHFCTLNCKIYCWRNNQTDSCSRSHFLFASAWYKYPSFCFYFCMKKSKIINYFQSLEQQQQ